MSITPEREPASVRRGLAKDRQQFIITKAPETVP